MDTNYPYFDCLCRTCMNELVEATSYDGNTKPQQWQSIFDRIEECGAFRIAELLTNAVPQIEVQPRDELPKRICCKCFQELLIVYRFQQMCIQSEQQMRQQVSKKRSDLEIPMIGAAMEGEIETHKAGSYPLKTLQSSTTHQNLEHSSIHESLLETTEQMIKPEAAETSDDDIDKLLEDCRDAEGNLSEFVKNEPIEDDEPSIEYSDDETTISEKGERLSIEFEEEQINEADAKACRITHGKDKPHECPYCPRRFRTKQHMFTHKEIHEGVKKETCDICGKIINKRDLKQHKLGHSNEKPHKCDFCEKRFDKICHLRVHIRKHTGEKPYKCKYCERSFSYSSHRIRHMRVHLGDSVHRCELCPLAFPAMPELRIHFTTHKNEAPETRERNMKALREAEAINVEKPKCPHCSQRFSNYANMLQHKAIHKRAKINCDICGKSFTSGNLKEHKRIHSGEKPHKCHLCEKSFTKKENLRVHIRSHTGEKPYKCKYCERSYSNPSDRMKHMRLHLGDNVHRCALCPLAFPAASELRAHFTTHETEDLETRERNMKALKEAEAELEIKAKDTGPNYANMLQHKAVHKVAKINCDICGKSIRKDHLKVHKRIHSGEKPHKCHLCEKSFIQMTSLRFHIRTHTGEKPYKCKYCERSYSQNISRMKHMRLHLGDNVYRCELCPLAFPAASELREHFTTHKNEDPETRERNMKALKEAEAELEIKAKEHVEKHKCPHCPRRFSNYANILQHKEIHKSTRINCDTCGKSIRKDHLKTHKRIHSGEKPHKCHLCGNSFTKMSNLRVHIRSHTGEKPYKCKYCGRSFTQAIHRMKHMRLHLGDNVHRCELCPLVFPAMPKLRIHFTTHKNEDPETRERNMKALKEAEAKLQQQFVKKAK